jgi:hypothetical protein
MIHRFMIPFPQPAVLSRHVGIDPDSLSPLTRAINFTVILWEPTPSDAPVIFLDVAKTIKATQGFVVECCPPLHDAGSIFE